MCQFVSFFHNPLTGDIRVYDLNSHSETEKGLSLDLKVWREGHYLPNGEIVCRLTPEDRITKEEANERLRSRFPKFKDFLNWAFVELNAEKKFSGGLDLSGCDLKGIKLPTSVGGGLYLSGNENGADECKKMFEEMKAKSTKKH